ncbi:3'-5' exonuclease [Helicobacter monodelphidis]|uniref:3'-5' exonuclease n=1 Tax=Helicobacter sp. 15-1451 TaxID=2004995 RepID=UPI000DCD9DDA|nr:3'-5' exonuclease [Helicobacter sp. 15-1451]RAX57245.1 3'-5' exonuclease [Helicobacter sp. 15-1451]
MLCVFDCESIPDTQLLRKIYGYEGDDLEICEQAFKAQEELSGSSFLPHAFHKIISIAALIADESGNMIKIGCFEEGGGEKAILSSFLQYLNTKQPRLVSFNGRGFDIPTILLRAMQYNLNAEAYFETTNPTLKKDKWENYRQRYSERFHLDLFDVLGHYGAATKGLRLNVLANMCGLPGKYDIYGDEVYRLYFENQQERIDTYCQSDVLNTYWVYLKYQLLSGVIQLSHYRKCLESMGEKIPQDKEYADIFLEAIQAEIQAI